MSTAEQIIADSLKALGVIDYASVAAHVVAALTNAGKTIVDLPEADEMRHDTDINAGHQLWRIAAGEVVEFDGDIWPRVRSFGVKPAAARELAAALLAAARVAEGGERRG
ncbi:hypothetical protein GS474_15990 [Rhodococcus hoagii]|nr:hypothetical protein [Prescottella equi]